MKVENTTNGGGCLTFFGGIFLLAGLFIGFLGLKTVYKGLSASDWQPVSASILQAELKVSRGDDSNTYRAVGQFEYVWQGQTYQSEQLHFGGGSDNIGSFHQDLVTRMRDHQTRRASMQAWVNPADPSEAVLVKDIRWGMFGFMMIFPLVFGGVGLGIIFAGRWTQRKSKQTALLQAQHPTEPWRWRDEWKSATIQNNSKGMLLIVSIFAGLWNAISFPILFIVPQEIDKGNWLALIGLLFPLIGLGLLYWWYVTYQRWKRFADCQLDLKTYPAALGYPLRAVFSTSEHLPYDSKLNIKLSAIHSYTSGSGDDRSTKEDILWQDEQNIPGASGAYSQRYELPLDFRIPKDFPQSERLSSDNEYLWRMTIRSELDGADLEQNFEIPVFDPSQYDISHAVGASDEQAGDYANDAAGFQSDVDERYIDPGVWQDTKVIYELRPEGHYYFVPPGRHKSMALFTLFMGLVFGGVGIGGTFIDDFPLLLSIVFSLAGLAFLYGLLRLWLHRSEFTISHDRLTVREGMLWMKTQELNKGDIKELKLVSNMSSGDTKYYSLEAHTYLGDKHTLARQLLGKRDVEALVQKIRNELDIK